MLNDRKLVKNILQYLNIRGLVTREKILSSLIEQVVKPKKTMRDIGGRIHCIARCSIYSILFTPPMVLIAMIKPLYSQ